MGKTKRTGCRYQCACGFYTSDYYEYKDHTSCNTKATEEYCYISLCQKCGHRLIWPRDIGLDGICRNCHQDHKCQEEADAK